MSLNTWCFNKLESHDKVSMLEEVSASLYKVTTAEGQEFIVFAKSEETSSVSSVTGVDLSNLDFFLNIAKQAYIDGGLVQLASNFSFGIGDLSDLLRALNRDNISNYVTQDIEYVMENLPQHTQVINLERLDYRRFKIHRLNLPSVTILVLNDYELTVDAVRSGIRKYGKFDAILSSNPNRRPLTTTCQTAVNSARLQVFSWRELFGHLNKTW